MGFTFYSEHDLDPKTGRPKADYPAWYNPRNIRELEDKVQEMEFALENGYVPKGYLNEYKELLAASKEQLEKVKDMTAVEDGKNNVDDLSKALKEGGELLRDAMPSVNEMESRRQLVNADEEYRRMSTPCISVRNSPKFVEVMKACKIPIADNGMVSREQIARAWKIGTRYLGEFANTERLRRLK